MLGLQQTGAHHAAAASRGRRRRRSQSAARVNKTVERYSGEASNEFSKSSSFVADNFGRSLPIQWLRPQRREIIAEFELVPRSVCLEITERVVVSDIENARRTLNSQKDIGIQIAIDDLGIGFAVLSHLKSLSVDMLKLETTFVRESDTNASDLVIVDVAEPFDHESVGKTRATAETSTRHGRFRARGHV